jgi:2-polyprenyl-3-methyl-5-hydroxy-6-metoxy-1,4-benzoquinol methylase
MQEILSPLTYKKAKYVKSISTKYICQEYSERYNIDVHSYFTNLTEINIFECEQTGLRFYSPENISGDSDFYKSLEKYPWYYSPWKWEHIFTSKYIKEGQSILEIGCGQGAFLSRIQQDFNVKALGLELNKDANFLNDVASKIESIENHAIENKSKYDLVCNFHVLEHVPALDSFLKSSIEVLKNGALMLIAVPNNATFIKNDFKNVLNMPPHHVGLWTEESLKRLTSIYPLELIEIKTEPLKKSQLSWYFDVLQDRKKIKINKFVLKVLKLLMIPFLKFFKGQTVIVVFRKVSN